MKENGIHLQSAGEKALVTDLAPSAVKAGAKVGANTPDGLYLYSATERKRCAEWLFDQIHDQAMDKVNQKAGILGGVVELFTQLANNVGNEFLNSFARDMTVTADGDQGWEDTVDASAVSPDNILWWNGPDAATPGPCKYPSQLHRTAGLTTNIAQMATGGLFCTESLATTW